MSEPRDCDKAAIRLARAGDAGYIAVLCEQLGYPSSQEQVHQRLHQIQQRGDHAVYIAERSDGRVIGWVHVLARQLLVVDPHVEIGGLVVDEAYHHRGVGQLLMEQAEQWAGEQGCGAVYLRSNVVREDAHAFYERIGYTNVKRSKVFRKTL